jgi:hypothetical protein
MFQLEGGRDGKEVDLVVAVAAQKCAEGITVGAAWWEADVFEKR